jgi:aryl-alcohol dehydrogenase-like predicted oxidoreductase
MLERIGLGTAQFGSYYGRFNADGIPSTEAVGALLGKARDYGLTVVDTASQYGESELVLGRWRDRLAEFDVITKTPNFSSERITHSDKQQLRLTFERSLRLLGLPSLGCLLIHDGSNLLLPGGEMLYEELVRLRQAGYVRRVGISGYSGDVVEKIVNKFPLDVVQVPVNVLDRRLTEGGTLARLASLGIEIHARSAFLQGLLLADPDRLPPSFESVRQTLKDFRRSAADAGVTPAQAALHYLLGIPEIAKILVGVESIAQLETTFASFPESAPMNYDAFRFEDTRILDPVSWVS